MSDTVSQTGVPTWISSLLGPADLGRRRADVIRNAFQVLLNRTEWLRQFFHPSGGVQRLRSVDTIAQLKAITGAQQGDVCAVVPPGAPDLPSLWIFRSGYTTPGTDTPYVRVLADDLSGSWVNVTSTLTTSSSIASTAPQPPVMESMRSKYQLKWFNILNKTGESVTFVTPSTWFELSSLKLGVTPISPGDLVEIVFHVDLVLTTSSSPALIGLAIQNTASIPFDGSGTPAVLLRSEMALDPLSPVHLSRRYIASTAHDYGILVPYIFCSVADTVILNRIDFSFRLYHGD